MTSENVDKRSVSKSPSLLVYSLLALGVISVLSGLVAAIVVVAAELAAESSGQMAALKALGVMVAGGCVGAVMWALAWLCRGQHQRATADARIATALEQFALGAEVPTSAGSGGADEAPSELLEQLRELNVNILLSEKQRTSKRRYITERRGDELTELIDSALADGETDKATEHLDELVNIAPDRARVRELRSKINRIREEAERQIIDEATARADDLMAAGDFDRAETVANGLLTRRPDLDAAGQLLARVRREGKAFVVEQRAGMYRAVEQEATGRRWRAARDAAEALLEAYPDSAEADAVRAQIGTINDNARLEEVRERRDDITNLIERRRFREAIERSRELIRTFPETAAAEDLERQMERLEGLAAGQEVAR